MKALILTPQTVCFQSLSKRVLKLIYSKSIMWIFSMWKTQIMRHYPYEYPLWCNLAQAMKCDIYLKLWSYAQNCTLLYCEKKLGIRYGAQKPVMVSCSHCHVDHVINDIILCSAGFVLNGCLLNRCGKCTYVAINTFWIWIWIWT